jgi:hypothetical protein
MLKERATFAVSRRKFDGNTAIPVNSLSYTVNSLIKVNTSGKVITCANGGHTKVALTTKPQKDKATSTVCSRVILLKNQHFFRLMEIQFSKITGRQNRASCFLNSNRTLLSSTINRLKAK